jgi:hypothetical protein
MNSSSRRKQDLRRSSPVAESLEGRQLLSTTATATTNATTTAAAVSMPAMDPGGFAAHGFGFDVGRIHGGGFGRFGGGGEMMPDFGGRSAPTTLAASATSTSATPMTTTAMTPAPVSTAAPTMSPTSTVAPTTSAPASATLPWAGGMFGLRDGFGGAFGLSNFAGASAASTLSVPSTSAPSTGAMIASPFAGQFGGGWGGASSTSGTTPTLSTSAQAEHSAFQQLQTDEQAIYDKSQVTPALQAALSNDLTALAKEVTQAPSTTTVLALQSDLATVAGNLPTSAQLATIQTDFTAVLTSAGVTDPTGVTKTFSDLSALLTATNIGSSDITTLTTDLKAAGLSTNSPLAGVDIGVNLDSLVSTVVIAGFKATAASSTMTPAAPTPTSPTSTTTATTATS